MNLYTSEEQETICNYDRHTNTWSVYTCVAKHITKLTKLYGDPDWFQYSEDGNERIIAAKWEGLKSSQVSFRKESKRVMTDEQKENAAERLRLAREKKNEQS